ncbi:484_t:CDS:1, partial [Cetraspora pellucida]
MSFEQLSININPDNNKGNFKADTSHDDNPFDNNDELNFSINIGISHGGNSFNNAKMNFRSNDPHNNNKLNFSIDISTSYSGDSSDIDNNIDNESSEGHNSMISKKQATSIDNNATILVGQTFVDWYNLKQHIDSYVIKQGFATRLSHTENTLGFITRAKIVCRCAGAPSNKSTGLQKTKSIAIECPCKIVICWSKNAYYVKSVNLQHIHYLDTDAIVFDPSHRKLSNNENIHVQMLYDRSVPVSVIVDMLTEQYDRYIHNKDVYNSLNNRSRDYVKGLSQTAELLNTLNNNKKYLVTYSVNNSKLHCLFFATRFALSTFKRYSEILLIDSTYKTNRVGMPLLLISGIDVTGLTFLIASGLLANETAPSFCWILHQLKQAIGDITVHSIRILVTDRDLALISA